MISLLRWLVDTVSFLRLRPNIGARICAKVTSKPKVARRELAWLVSCFGVPHADGRRGYDKFFVVVVVNLCSTGTEKSSMDRRPQLYPYSAITVTACVRGIEVIRFQFLSWLRLFSK
jgi:hypothetical protein